MQQCVMDKQMILEKIPFWGHLQGEEKERILRASRIQQYNNKELIYTPAKECLGLFYIVAGVIRVYLTDDKGNKATVFRLHQDQCCVLSMSCMLSEITFDVEIASEGESRLLLVPTTVLSPMSEENVYIENFSYKVITEKFSGVMDAMHQLMFLSLEQRIVTFLLDEVAATKSSRILMTQEQLAESIGSAREAVSRILTKLSKKGYLTTRRGEITLLDKTALYGLLDS